MSSIWIIVAFVVYLGFMVGIGVFFSRKSANVSDYFLGGRSMGSWLTALSAQASDMSSWLLMGLPGAVYVSGISSAWIAIGLALGTYLNWKFVAERLRKYSEATGNAITIPQYLQNRFNATGCSIRVVCSVIICVFFLIYTASGFNAAAKLVNEVFGLDYKVGLTIGVIVIMVYTFLGGYFAVVWTDFFQGMLMFFALLLVPIVAYVALDSVSVENLSGIQGYFSLTQSPKGEVAVVDIISNIGWGLGYFGMPHILIRFMSIKSSDLVKKSRIIAMVWVIISLMASVAVGVIGYAYLGQKGIFLNGAAAAETVFIKLVPMIAPAFLAGILLCAIVSAIMSTSDSQLLVTASAVSNDIYKIVFKKNATDKELLLVGKIAVLIVAVIAYVIALNPENTVMGLVSNAWAGFGAAFGPTIVLSLFWKRMTMKGALFGMVAGGVFDIVWLKCFYEYTGLYELVPAFFVSAAVIVIVSLCDKKPSAEILETFEKVNG